MVGNKDILIIQIPYGGFGDHLFHSHIPRIAKEFGGYKNVFVSSKSLIRQKDHLELVWKLNPYVDGFVEQEGISCNLAENVEKARLNKKCNLLDFVMFSFNLDDGQRYHEPELYYKPKYMPEYHKSIYDPNHFTYIGDFNKADLYAYMNKNRISYDAIMKIRGNKSLHKNKKSDFIIEAPNIYEFCDVLFSAKYIYCFTSGTATLSAALNKPATVFYGEGINKGFHHSKLHTYTFINHCLKTKIKEYIKNGIKKVFHFKEIKCL